MKRLINKIIDFFSSPQIVVWGDPAVRWTVVFERRLGGNEVTTLLNRAVDRFPPNCKPYRISVYSDSARFEFSNGCMDSIGLRKVVEGLFPNGPKIIDIRWNNESLNQ